MRINLRTYAGLLVRMSLLTLILWGSNLWLVRIRDSIHSHRSVLAGQPSLQDPTNPLVQQVVMVLIGGLSYDSSLEMPYLNTLREQGFDARCTGYYPSYSQSAWTTLVSGAGPEISDAPLVNVAHDQLSLLTVDGIFTEAKRADLTTALSGFHWWEMMIPEQVLDHRFFTSASAADADDQVIQTAREFMSNLPPNFLLIHLSQVGEAAQNHGTDSQEYEAAVLRADSQVREIAEAMSLRRNVLIVTSDHGYLANGGHGGADEQVVFTPFVMVGGRAAQAHHDGISQADIAPTIAALLGLAVPSASQGEILFDALLMDEAESTEKWVCWSQQRVELADVYLESIGQEPLSEASKGDAEVARSSLLVRNYGSAQRLAEFAVRGATSEMLKARGLRTAAEQRRRLPVVALPVLAIAYLLWRRWSRTTAVLLVCALATAVIYNLLFIWDGQVHSFSTVLRWDAFVADSLVLMATSLIPALCILVWMVWRQQRRPSAQIATVNYSFALILAYLLALPLAMTYVLNGFEITWRLPDPLLAFVQVSSLVQLGVLSFLTLIVPLVTIPLDRMLRWIGARVSSPRSSGTP